MAAIERRDPDPRHAAVGLLINGGDGIGHPLAVRRNLRVAGLLKREIVFSRDTAVAGSIVNGLRPRSAGKQQRKCESAHVRIMSDARPHTRV